MLRSFIPYLLATLALILFALSVILPLFEWQISETGAGASSTCNDTLPSSLTTSMGESLDWRDNPFLSEHLSFVVRSSQSARIIEGMTRNINEDIIPLFWFLPFLCGIYTWWYAIYHKRTVAETLISPLATIIFLCILINVGRLFSPHFSRWWCLQGAFNAELSRIHYETLLLLFTALLAEVGSIVVMLRQIIKAIMQRNESAKLSVG